MNMSHRYLNDIGIESIDSCVFNSEDRDGDNDRLNYFLKQREEYGFDDRETWSLDYTSAGWLYSHLLMYKEIGGEVVDLNFHKFLIPVLHDMTEEEIRDEMLNYDLPTPKSFQKEKLEEHTQLECIDYMINYLRYYLESNKHLAIAKEFDKLHEYEVREVECLQAAFKIYSIIIPSMWW